MTISLKATDIQYRPFVDLIDSLSKDARLKPSYRNVFKMFNSESTKQGSLVTACNGINLLSYIQKSLTALEKCK